MEHYIAQKEILTVTVLEDKKTPVGDEMVLVTFTDSSTEEMPKKRLEILSEEKPYDLSELQRKINTKVGAMLFSVLHEYGLKIGETGQVADALIELVNLAHARAKEILIGFESSVTPLIAINNILVKDYGSTEQNKEGTDGAPSDGGGSDTEDKK